MNELEIEFDTLNLISKYWIIDNDVDLQYIEELYRDAKGDIENMFLLIYKLIQKDIKRQKDTTYAQLRAIGDQQVTLLKKIINRIDCFEISDKILKIRYHDGYSSRYTECVFQEWIRIIKEEFVGSNSILESQVIKRSENVQKIVSILRKLIDNYPIEDIIYKYGTKNSTVNTELYRHIKPYYRFLEDTIFHMDRTSSGKIKVRHIYLHICSKLHLHKHEEAMIKKYLNKSIEKFPSNFYSGLAIANNTSIL